jgi:hypothetical protein
MNGFIVRHGEEITGRLDGFDRMRLVGTLRMVANAEGLSIFLHKVGVRLKEFGAYAEGVTQRLKAASLGVMERAGRPALYLPSAAANKEEAALAIAERDGITEGPVCAITCVEPCMAFEIRKGEDGMIAPRAGLRKCLHVYHYYLHPALGWMHARLQTWFPFTITVCLNGREWLSRLLTKAGVGYAKRENCFVHIADPERAQELLDSQLRTDWPKLLEEIARELNPAHAEEFRAYPLRRYWSAQETEWASDVVFRSPEALSALYPGLVRHAMTVFDSGEVMRFLGGRTLNGHFDGEVTTKLRRRVEGVCVKHRAKRNWIKMYDKQGSVLRVETVINDTRDFKAYRTPEGKPGVKKSWQRMRKGVADLHRRAEVSQKANERYLESLAAAERPDPLGELLGPLCRPTRDGVGRRARALNPLGEDAAVLRALAKGEFLLNGFRNRDLRRILDGEDPADPVQAKRRSAAIGRRLRLLRAHGLITKVTATTRYQLTAKGRQVVAAVAAAQDASIAKLAAA